MAASLRSMLEILHWALDGERIELDDDEAAAHDLAREHLERATGAPAP